MILLVHLLLGAAIGSAVKNIPLAIILALLSHYFLDSIPHIEYSIENITKRQWRHILPEALKVLLDLCLGFLLVFLFSNNNPIIYICAFAALIPDGISVLSLLFPAKLLERHNQLHTKIHFLEENDIPDKKRKISAFWRIFIQVIVVIISLSILKF